MIKISGYNLKMVNMRRTRLKLEPIQNAGYHCVECGDFNNPFAYQGKIYERLLKRNLCNECLKGNMYE